MVHFPFYRKNRIMKPIKVLELSEVDRLKLEKGYHNGPTHSFRIRCKSILLKSEGKSALWGNGGLIVPRCWSREHPIHRHCCQSCAHLTVRIVFLAVLVRFPGIGSRKQPNHSRKSYASVLSVLIDSPRSPVSGRNKLVVLSNYRSGCCIARHRSGKKPERSP